MPPRRALLLLISMACNAAPDAAPPGQASTTGAPVGSTTAPTSTTTTGGSDEPADTAQTHDTDPTSDTGHTSETTTTGGGSAVPRYGDVRQKSSHNSFQRDEALLDQILQHRVRSLELDIHHSSGKSPDIAGDWYVYHIDIIDDASHCRRLSQCLTQLAATAQVLPEHEVLTIWVDLKDGFNVDHPPADLDAQLQQALGARLLRPAELLAACPAATTLREAVTLPGCGWPELTALRGRVIVALTGGGLDDPETALAQYIGADAHARAAFVAPDLESPTELESHPEAVFHNLALADVAAATAVHEAGQISRVWVADDADAWASAVAASVHHIASNKVNAAVDPWGTTAGPGGWPFTCLADCEAPLTEPGALLSMTVDSGDLWGESDDALLATWAPAGDLTLTAVISGPNSHVEPFAKGCLIARESDAPAAPYLAICRPADEQPLRVQLRTSAGASSEAIELEQVDGLTLETPAFARLERAGACVRGLTSVDGEAWSLLAEHCFAAPLPHVGIVASSHGEGPVRMIFAGLTASPGGPITAESLKITPLARAQGTVIDGW